LVVLKFFVERIEHDVAVSQRNYFKVIKALGSEEGDIRHIDLIAKMHGKIISRFCCKNEDIDKIEGEEGDYHIRNCEM
jgi:hypothetical protein